MRRPQRKAFQIHEIMKDNLQADESRERLLSALLHPTIEMMIRAGISRMSCSKDKGFVLQMESGEVIEVDSPTPKESKRD